MIDIGRYKAKATGRVVLGTSSKKSTPFIECYFVVTEDGSAKGEQVRWTSYFGENSSERTIESLVYCGWTGEDPGEFADGALHGIDTNEVEIVVEHEQYEKDGETKTAARVQWVNKLGGYLNVDNAMTPEEAATFGDKMKGLVLKVREKKNVTGDGAAFNFGANASNGEQPKSTGTGGRKSF